MAVDRAVEEIAPSPGLSPAEATGLHLYLVPHPDDELSAWTSLTDAAKLWPVIVVLTQGEQTGRCADVLDQYLQVELGERVPVPLPVTGRGSSECRQARLGSLREWLTQAAESTPAVAYLGSGDVEVHATAVGPAQLTVGRQGALVVLDLGDGRVTADIVQQAVDEVLRLDGVPALPLARITAAAYYAEADATTAECPAAVLCPPGGRPCNYPHLDHKAVRDAARTIADRASDGAWLVTTPYDPAAAVFRALPRPLYETFMGLDGPDPITAHRTGSFQQVYGWLAFPDAWRTGDLPLDQDQVLFSRVQSFEVVLP